MIRQFSLCRDEDVSGISGTGRVAEGVVFSDGCAVLRWCTQWHTTGIYESITQLDEIHGHQGRTRIVWDDQG